MKEVKGWNYSFGRQEGKEHSFFFSFFFHSAKRMLWIKSKRQNLLV
jgi:hypothetical protein